MRLLIIGFFSVVLTAHAQPPASQITMGNGADNWIVTDGATRSEATFVFPEVKIAGNGWLVMNPFKDGRPDGDIYVGHTYVEDGVSKG